MTFAVVDRPEAQPADTQTMVVAELFTSEGCSSCPPADDVLRRLVAEQPIGGVTVVALGQHVDSWDRLGWRDPFSSAAFSERQSAYDAQVFRSGRIYTPQIVIDGHLEQIGSDEAAVRAAVRRAARAAKASVTVASATRENGALQVAVRVEAPPTLILRYPVDIMAAITEDELATNVRRGENGGRVLRHAAVVRSLAPVGQLSPDAGAQTATAMLALAPEWNAKNLRVVAFVQERDTRRIMGAGSRPLAPSF